MKDDAATILDIDLAFRRIRSFVAGVDESRFHLSDEKRWAVVSQLASIGEAVQRLSQPFRDAHPDVPWKQIAGMRNRLVHAYDKIDWSLIWKTATSDVPDLLVVFEPLAPERDADEKTPESG